jgi:hypothetical protein
MKQSHGELLRYYGFWGSVSRGKRGKSFPAFLFSPGLFPIAYYGLC